MGQQERKHTTSIGRIPLFSFVKENNTLELLEGEKDQIEYDTDPMLIEASALLNRVCAGSISIDILSTYHQALLAYYFYKKNYIVRRAINLKIKIPLSALSIIKPKLDNDILQDVVYDFFKTNLENVSFKEVLNQILFNYYVYGRAFVIVDLVNDNNNYQKFDYLDSNFRITYDKQKMEKMNQILDRYNVNPEEITQEEIHDVVSFLMPLFDTNFRGIKRMQVFSIFGIESISENSEINYMELEIPVSFHIKSYVEKRKSQLLQEMTYTDIEETNLKIINVIVKELVDIGYTSHFAKLNVEAVMNGEETIFISNDTTQSLFFIEVSTDDKTTPLLPILEELVDLHTMKMKRRKKVNSIDKKVKVVTSTSATPDEVSLLVDDITTLAQENDISILGTNYDISVEEIDFAIKDSLSDDDTSDLIESVASGTGIPSSLISGDDSYGNSFISMQLLQTEYNAITTQVINKIIDGIMKPISIKKGFMIANKLGKPQIVYPRIGFYKGSVIIEDYIDKISDLIGENKLPISVLIENYLGFDYEEVLQEMKKENQLRKEILSDDDDNSV